MILMYKRAKNENVDLFEDGMRVVYLQKGDVDLRSTALKC